MAQISTFNISFLVGIFLKELQIVLEINYKQKQMQNKQNVVEHEQSEIIEQKSSKANGATIIKKYSKGRFLGKGGFAKCYEVTNLQSKKVSAIKIISKQTLKKSKAKQKLVTEIKIHKSLEHKNVIGFDHVFQDNENVYIVLQLCNNHTLNQMIKKRKRISELEVQYFLYQIIQGLIYIHSTKVIHRDLKLGNLMLSENMEIKIGDFGLAAKLEFSNEKRKTICGTPNYLAPEIINNTGHSFQVDIWSLGVIMFALIYGRPPFQTSDVKKTYKKIKQCQYCFNEEISVSQNAKNLISRILIVDPSKRLTLDQIMSHPFMTSSKMPKQLPVSVLTQPLARSYIEQYTFCGGVGISRYNSSSKPIDKIQNEDRARSQKGISERLLLRTSSGLTKNLLGKNFQKEDGFYNNPTPNTLSNNFFNKPDSAKSKGRINFSTINTVYVKKWVDYSSKYGLGYLLSDGTTGIYFNDSTKMLLDQSGQKVDYVNNQIDDSKKLASFNVNSNLDNKEIHKKVTLMQYFRKYLNGNSSFETQNQKKQNSPPFVYVKKWIKSDQAILFRLNNLIIQVNFNDKSQIVLYCDKELILYSNANGKDKQILEINSPDIRKSQQISSRMEHVKVLLKKVTQVNKIEDSPSKISQKDIEVIRNY